MARATKLRVVGGKTQVYVTPRAPRHGLEVGAPCPNCGTALAGPWCYACGQKGEEFHRSVRHLVAEAFEGLTHFDGRFWTTVPRLITKPAQLTRAYLDGHRAAQIPPFRLFLIVLLIVFFAGSQNFKTNKIGFELRPLNAMATSPKQAAAYSKLGAAIRTDPSGRWLMDRGEAAQKHPEAFFAAMGHWSHRFAILMLPIAALMLALLFAFKRGVYVFDHLIFSMHSLAFQGLLLSTVFLIPMTGAAALLILAPVHLFFHMRGTYRISILGTLIRMLLLFSLSTAAFVLLMMGLVFVGLATAH